MMSECILMHVDVFVRKKMHAVGVFLCLLGEVGKGSCVYLLMFKFTDSIQTLSVYVRSRKLKSLRAEKMYLRGQDVLIHTPTSHKQIT